MTFKIEFEIQTDKAITPEELKYEVKKKFDDLTVYNGEDEEVEIKIKNPWETIKITEQ